MYPFQMLRPAANPLAQYFAPKKHSKTNTRLPTAVHQSNRIFQKKGNRGVYFYSGSASILLASI